MDLFGRKEYETAIKEFKAALVRDEDYSISLNSIGISLNKMHRYREAIAIFNEVIKLNSNFYSAYYNRGCSYQKQGRKTLALQDFDVVLEQTNNLHISALINRSLIYAWLQDYFNAKQDLDRVIEIDSQKAVAYYNRALINVTLSDRKAYRQDLAIAEELFYATENFLGIAKIKQVRKSLKF